MGSRNIILLIVDAMSEKQLRQHDYRRLMPNYSQLCQAGISCSNAFAHSCVTEFAIPSIFSSRLPLDDGGYEFGLKSRPDTLLKVLQRAGYDCRTYSSAPPIDRAHGFGDSGDAIVGYYDIEGLWRLLQRAYLWHCNPANTPYAAAETFHAQAGNNIVRIFTALRDFCRDRVAEQADSAIVRSAMHRRNFAAIGERMAALLAEASRDPERYAAENYAAIMRSDLYEFIGLGAEKSWVSRFASRLDSRKLDGTRIKYTHALLRSGEKSVPGEVIIRAALRRLAQATGPQFLSLHIMDVHDALFGAGEHVIYAPARYRRARAVFGDAPWPVLRQAMAYCYFDEYLGHFLAGLERLGIRDNTDIVITADHGVTLVAGSYALSSPLPAGSFKDDYLSVPFVVASSQVAARHLDGLVGTIDVAPTICALAGLDSPHSFKGYSVLDGEPTRDHLIAEHTHRGPCSTTGKPIYMAVRSAERKLVYKTGRNAHDPANHPLVQLFDLARDPEETTNVAGEAGHAVDLARLIAIAQERCASLVTPG